MRSLDVADQRLDSESGTGLLTTMSHIVTSLIKISVTVLYGCQVSVEEEEKTRDWLSPLVELQPVTRSKEDEENEARAAEAKANAWRQVGRASKCSNDL